MIKTRVTKLTVTPGELFHERGFEVEIVDEAGGEFVEVRSNKSRSPLRIDVDEWPHLRDAIDRMFGEIAENESGGKIKELLETPEPWGNPASDKGPLPWHRASSDDGWIPWSGGECPVAPETIVLVHLAGLDHHELPSPASKWEWSRLDKLGDIIAYKVVD